ncbi:unnamed protein product, partial [Owenia fusiformis]
EFDNVDQNGTVIIEYTMKLRDEQNISQYEVHNETLNKVLYALEKCFSDLFFSLGGTVFSSMFKMMGICTMYDWASRMVLLQEDCDDEVTEMTLFEKHDKPSSSKHEIDSNDIKGYLTICCLALSILSMFVRIALQPFIPAYHSFPGKMQFCFVLSLCFAHILYLCGPFANGAWIICKVIGILIHYSFLCVFTWLAAIAFDMYRTFRLPVQNCSNNKTLLLYCFTVFLIPAPIVSISVVFDIVPIDTIFKPLYGNPLCQISNPNANLLFFAGPLACVIIFNSIMYILTVVSLRRSWRETVMVTNTHDYHIKVYIKLFIIMGFTWICGFICPFTHEALSYIFILLNASQGVFISVSSVLSKLVYRELKCCEKTNKNPTGATSNRSIETRL